MSNKRNVEMLYGKYEFICRFDKNAVLPEYKGSTFHGVFGRALKNVVCALKRQTCTDCPLKQRCLYVQVFETNLVQQPVNAVRYSDVPHPYIIEPSNSRQNLFEKDSSLSCALVLFGRFNRDLAYFIYAFDLMGKTGLGRRIDGSRGRFTLTGIQSRGQNIYSNEDKKINLEGHAYPLSVVPAGCKEMDRVTLTFKTPLRVKYKQRFASDLPFHVLARAMLRRVSGLMAAYGDGEPDIDYKGLVEKARFVETNNSKLQWNDWERYSFRQKKKMPMGGLVGSVTYEKVPAEFLPLLNFCEKVHIGKNTSFGLGKFTADINEPARQ